VGALPIGALSISADSTGTLYFVSRPDCTTSATRSGRVWAPGKFASALALASVLLVELATPAAATTAQESTGDGSTRYLLMAIGLVLLSALLGGLWRVYWKATVPPARRPYQPPPIPLPGE
jgi:hypothetical protein